jgi:N-acetylglucosamine kinase-like BadF-type ATPase
VADEAPSPAPGATDLVVGADLGGTSSRVLVAGLDGRFVARAAAGGGNPISHGAQAAAGQLRAALTMALEGLDAGAVRALVIGMAGGVADAAAARAFTDAIAGAGLRVEAEYIGDGLVAFSSATPLPSGTVLLAGTGATGARIHERRVAAVADGLGWLLGDHGSGFWLGREAVRAAVAALSGTGAATVLAESVPQRLLGDLPIGPRQRQRARIVHAVMAGPPIRLAALAVLVADAEASGDAVAAEICDRAAAHLLETIGAIRGPEEDTPLVLNGGVVRSARSPVGRRVRALAAARFAGDMLTPADGTAGAAWLAVRRACPAASEAHLAAVHRRLTMPAARNASSAAVSPVAPDLTP